MYSIVHNVHILEYLQLSNTNIFWQLFFSTAFENNTAEIPLNLSFFYLFLMYGIFPQNKACLC